MRLAVSITHGLNTTVVLLQGQLGKWWQRRDSLQLSCAPDRMVLQSHYTGGKGARLHPPISQCWL